MACRHVINYDLPHVPESYVHRIGRTARAGAAGTAIAFCDPDERPLLRDIERLIRQTIPVVQHALGKSNLPPAEHGSQAAPTAAALKPQGQKRQWNPVGTDDGKPSGDNRPRKRRAAAIVPTAAPGAPKRSERRQAKLDAGNQRRKKRPPPCKNGRVTPPLPHAEAACAAGPRSTRSIRLHQPFEAWLTPCTSG